MARQQRSTAFAQESTRTVARVAFYARVSTLNNHDPEMRLAELREYAGRRGWQIVEEFTDLGVSGCRESRPALNRLMSDACCRRFDAILIWKIDRFGRSLGQRAGRTLGVGCGIYHPARQYRFEHAVGSADVFTVCFTQPHGQ